MENKGEYNAFNRILKWSLILFVISITVGWMYRIVMPIERHLDEDEYIERVFVEFETVAWHSADGDAVAVGAFDGGSILYVIEEGETRVRVRPFTVSALDSVWVQTEDITGYTPERYRIWQYDEERRKYDLD